MIQEATLKVEIRSNFSVTKDGNRKKFIHTFITPQNTSN